ncbi:hypothetical protein CN355_24940 [Bacillus thuringiensis]|nr:hypothetical protein CN355_24940 [Bacillus thuringiensis]
MTYSLHQDPLGLSKRIRFGLPTGEGSPQGLRGWGVRLMGSRGRVPLVGSDKVRGFFAMLGMARRSRQASQTPIDFDALVSKYV